ncbi:unnamed protein product [Rotaria sp. Silwood1]|nr:unnamed protein product [Rotaria sp. Silwood1]CAF3936662.1 unnamed protein product [Rotaria sp. Silwood1]CAF3947804.1 unnamed protein product [Rotaria sp. Silwood1]CAF5015455.1 unnamed protein product [Rotaria sp. Silwood1]CAF5039018.1 unnamed protein product [Rotaria sp. Silwood1]
MQEKVLKSILLFFEDRSALSYDDIFGSVLQEIGENMIRSVESIVGLCILPCFQIIKDDNSSVIQLKSNFRNYESLRGGYDSKIIQIAMISGFYTSPEQWSLLLYGDT